MTFSVFVHFSSMLFCTHMMLAFAMQPSAFVKLNNNLIINQNHKFWPPPLKKQRGTRDLFSSNDSLHSEGMSASKSACMALVSAPELFEEGKAFHRSDRLEAKRKLATTFSRTSKYPLPADSVFVVKDRWAGVRHCVLNGALRAQAPGCDDSKDEAGHFLAENRWASSRNFVNNEDELLAMTGVSVDALTRQKCYLGIFVCRCCFINSYLLSQSRSWIVKMVSIWSLACEKCVVILILLYVWKLRILILTERKLLGF